MTKARTKRMENSVEIFNFFKLFDKQLKNIPFHNRSKTKTAIRIRKRQQHPILATASDLLRSFSTVRIKTQIRFCNSALKLFRLYNPCKISFASTALVNPHLINV